MKAQQLNKEQAAALIGATAKNVLALSSGGRVGKSRTGGPRSSSVDASAITEEMRVYFAKLKELVPFMPKNRKLSKLEIIQYVIDYICDLQLALEVHPAAASVTGSPAPSSPPSLVNGSSSASRQPLGVIAVVPSNTSMSHTCAAQEANHDKIPSHLDEINTRPVSC